MLVLNLNTGNGDTDADLCFKIMSLCCTYTWTTTYSKILSAIR